MSWRFDRRVSVGGVWVRAFLAAALLLGFAACPPAAGLGTFKIVNAAPGVLIVELYLVKTGSTDWGPNRLPVPLEYGETFFIAGITPGVYDEMAVALFPRTGETDHLVNETIAIQSGQTYSHIVHFVSDPL